MIIHCHYLLANEFDIAHGVGLASLPPHKYITVTINMVAIVETSPVLFSC